MITESAVHFGSDSFTFKRKCVALGNRRVERFSRFFDLLVARRSRQLLLARSERVIRDTGTGAGNRLVDRLFVGPGADLFALVAHDGLPGLGTSHLKRAAPHECSAVLRAGRGPPIYFHMTRSLPILPLRDIVVFPHRIVPLFVGREKSVAALEAAMAADKE